MLRHKPKFSYCGLTIVLSNPSRFDVLKLLSSRGGDFFENFCLQPDYNLMQCDVRLAEDGKMVEQVRRLPAHAQLARR